MTSAKSRKLLLIGIDQAIPELIDRYVQEGLLPNIAHMIQNGVYGRALSSPPCDTPTNWTTIATGVSSAKHSATSFYLHIPGESYEESFSQRSRTQLSRYCKVTHFWNLAEKAGYTPFILNYPSGWPAYFNHGVMSLYTWPIPESLPRILYGKSTHRFLIESLNLFSRKNSFSPSDKIQIQDWENARTVKITIPLQISLMLQEEHKKEDQIKKDKENEKIGVSHIITHDVHLLDLALVPADSSGISSHSTSWRFYYKTPHINEWIELTENSDSDWITFQILTEECSFHCLFQIKYTMDFNDNQSSPSCNIDCSPIFNTSGWTVPAEFGEKLVRNALIPEMAPRKAVEYMVATGIEPYLKFAQREVMGLVKTVEYSKNTNNWDVCFFHAHHLDTVNHKSLAFLSEVFPMKTDKKIQKAEINVRTAYQIVDEMVGYLLNNVVDERTLVVFTADHGAIPAWKIVNIPRILCDLGFMDYNYDESSKSYVVNWEKTKIFPYVEPPYIWINLKGRDPNGIIEAGVYEEIRTQIIEELKILKDPETDQLIFSHVFQKEEMPELKQNGQNIGDIVYFLNPPYEIFDDNLYQLDTYKIPKRLYEKPITYPAKHCFGAHAYYHPEATFGGFSVVCPVIFYGNCVNKDLKFIEPFWLWDLAPTFHEYLQIPTPAQYDGKIIKNLLNNN